MASVNPPPPAYKPLGWDENIALPAYHANPLVPQAHRTGDIEQLPTNISAVEAQLHEPALEHFHDLRTGLLHRTEPAADRQRRRQRACGICASVVMVVALALSVALTVLTMILVAR